jgi:hypothetical protein
MATQKKKTQAKQAKAKQAAKKAAPKKAAPKKAAPKKAAPKKAAPKKAAPKKAAPKKAAPKKAAPKKAAPKKAAPKKAGPKKAAGKGRWAGMTGKERLAEGILQAVTMTVIADGEFAAAEEALLRRFYAEPLFRGIGDLGAVVRDAIDRCVKDGLDAALSEVADDLGTQDARETAFTTCLAAAAADGHITSTEAHMLQRLRNAFRIPAKRARELAGPIAGALG